MQNSILDRKSGYVANSKLKSYSCKLLEILPTTLRYAYTQTDAHMPSWTACCFSLIQCSRPPEQWLFRQASFPSHGFVATCFKKMCIACKTRKNNLLVETVEIIPKNVVSMEKSHN